MPRKLTQGYVNKLFIAKGWTLLDKYINSKTKMKFICDKGHTHHITVDKVKRGQGCLYCSGKAKHTYEFIVTGFKKEGYTLISKEYINNSTPMFYICPKGHEHTTTWSDFTCGYRCPTCATIALKGAGSPRWKGGVIKKDLPLYKTYATQLEKYQSVHIIKRDGLKLLGVACIYCDSIFVPSRIHVGNRLKAVAGYTRAGEANFYCSENCKKACPTYRRKKYPKGFRVATSREVQPELRKLVLKRDGYICQICGIGTVQQQLHCHHMTGVELNPVESADIDNCITLCEPCHKKVHKLPGCGYNDLRRDKCKK